MFVRLTYLNFFPEKIEEVKNVYNNEIRPSIRRQPGNIDVMFLRPVNETDEYISCTIWNSRAEADTYQSGDQYSLDFSKIKQLTSQPPQVKYYDLDQS